MTSNGIASYPKRIVTLYTEDCGPMDAGGGHCPHCGAEGRYVYYFLCDDGKVHAAMSGCIKLFPHENTRFSRMVETALEKEAEATKLQRNLASWFKNVLIDIDRFQLGEISFEEFRNNVEYEASRRLIWLKNNGYAKVAK